MQTSLDGIEPGARTAALDSECAFCGIADLGRPMWMFCVDCQSQHAVCLACAQMDVEGEGAA